MRETKIFAFSEKRSRFLCICESWSLNSNKDIHQALKSSGFVSLFKFSFFRRSVASLDQRFVCGFCLFVWISSFVDFFLLMCCLCFQRTKKFIVWEKILTWIFDSNTLKYWIWLEHRVCLGNFDCSLWFYVWRNCLDWIICRKIFVWVSEGDFLWENSRLLLQESEVDCLLQNSLLASRESECVSDLRRRRDFLFRI